MESTHIQILASKSGSAGSMRANKLTVGGFQLSWPCRPGWTSSILWTCSPSGLLWWSLGMFCGAISWKPLSLNILSLSVSCSFGSSGWTRRVPVRRQRRRIITCWHPGMSSERRKRKKEPCCAVTQSWKMKQEDVGDAEWSKELVRGERSTA